MSRNKWCAKICTFYPSLTIVHFEQEVGMDLWIILLKLLIDLFSFHMKHESTSLERNSILFHHFYFFFFSRLFILRQEFFHLLLIKPEMFYVAVWILVRDQRYLCKTISETINNKYLILLASVPPGLQVTIVTVTLSFQLPSQGWSFTPARPELK